MSRRRDPRDAVPAAPTWSDVAVLCTGRGTHERWSFGAVQVSADGVVDWETLKASTASPYVAEGRPGRTFQFACRRCRRDVPLTQESLERLAREKAKRHAQRDIDVSALWSVNLTKQ